MRYQGNIGTSPLQQQGYYAEEREEIRAAFARFSLPLPEAGEYMHIRLGYLIGMPSYGAVIRAERNDPNRIVMPIDHPLILQPVGTIMKERQRFELCPGVPQVGINQKDYNFLTDALRKSGLAVEASGDDCGYLPVRTPDFPQGIPVVIDRTDVRWHNKNLTNSFAAGALSHLPAALIRAQAGFYAGLREDFAAFKKNQNPSAAEIFWKAMRQAATDGTLFARWRPGTGMIDMQHLTKGDEIFIAGENYDQSLRAVSPHAAILRNG